MQQTQQDLKSDALYGAYNYLIFNNINENYCCIFLKVFGFI
jgi:hypothetical protein